MKYSKLYYDVIDDVQITYFYVIWAKESESEIRFEISWELTKLLALLRAKKAKKGQEARRKRGRATGCLGIYSGGKTETTCNVFNATYLD